MFSFYSSCPPANNVFGLTRGFQRSAANIQPGGTYDIETEAFVFQSGVPQSHQYFVGCYLDYCFGNYSADDDDCQFVRLFFLWFEPIGSASANFIKFRGIRPRMYIEDLL